MSVTRICIFWIRTSLPLLSNSLIYCVLSSIISPHILSDMDFLPELCIDKHVKYLYDYANERCSIEGFFVENIKVGGMYWSLTTLALICPEAIYKNLPESDGFNIYDKSLKLLSNCKNEDGGFGNSPGHESHLIPTHVTLKLFSMPF